MEENDRITALTPDGQYRLLVESISDYAVYMLDANGYITSWNRGAQRFKGYETREILGQHFSRFYRQEDRDSGLPQKALATAEREGKFESEGWRIRKDGTRFWAHVIIDPIRDSDGTLLGFAKITRDLSERKKAERVLEKTREALFQSQKMDAVGQLTGGVAHDFNNLLMAILGSLELARKKMPDDAKMLQLVDNAIQAARRGAALTQRMLAFARRQELNPLAIDLPPLVHGMTELLQRSLGPSITIETHFPLGLPPVRADVNQLELALLNLAVNARDAMPEGGAIVVSARAETIKTQRGNLEPGKYVCLSVTDTGEGMDKDTLARAMEPFFTTKGVGKGTGLGLSMVLGLTEQLGGGFVLDSEPGKGTTAQLWLLQAKRSVSPAAGEVSVVPEPPMRPLTVLAVDDDQLVLLNTLMMLEDLGHIVFEAASGRQALEILRQGHPIDLLVTDQAMPRMTGAQLAAEVRKERPDLPIILATGYAELPPDADPSLLRLSKPFDQRELTRFIADAMRQKAPS